MKKIKKKIILFDFDGVIADSFKVAFEVNKEIDPLVSVGTEDDFRNLFNGNINDWGKNSAVAKKEVKRINEEFFKRYIPQMKKIKMFPGIGKTIGKLAKKYKLLIISSTITSPIYEFLKRNDILLYFDEVVGDNIVHTNKTKRMKKVFDKYNVGCKDCVFITDTLGDMREAASVGIQSIGVTWGFQKKKNLLKGKPLAVAEKPEELLGIVSNYC